MTPTGSSFSRRTFVKNTAAAAVTGVLASSLVPSGACAGAATSPPAARAAAADRPLRLGLIAAASYGRPGQPRTSGSNHGTGFATSCNGFDESRRAAFTGTFVAASRRIPAVEIVRLWDPLRAAAENLAAVCRIPTVCARPEDCADGVDAVIIADDGSGEPWRYATAPLQRGVPTFCSKPLAMTAHDARAIAQVARRAGTPFMSGSGLRFVPDIVALAREAAQLGELRLASVTGTNDLVYDGIHGLSMAYAVFGRGAVSCRDVGQPGRHLVRVRYGDGRDIMLIVGARDTMRAGYQITLFGSKGWKTVTPRLTDLHAHTLEAFFELVRTGRERVPIEEEVEVIAVLAAAQRSLDEGREVTVAEMLG